MRNISLETSVSVVLGRNLGQIMSNVAKKVKKKKKLALPAYKITNRGLVGIGCQLSPGNEPNK